VFGAQQHLLSAGRAQSYHDCLHGCISCSTIIRHFNVRIPEGFDWPQHAVGYLLLQAKDLTCHTHRHPSAAVQFAPYSLESRAVLHSPAAVRACPARLSPVSCDCLLCEPLPALTISSVVGGNFEFKVICTSSRDNQPTVVGQLRHMAVARSSSGVSWFSFRPLSLSHTARSC